MIVEAITLSPNNWPQYSKLRFVVTIVDIEDLISSLDFYPCFRSSGVHFEYLGKKKPPEILDFKRL